MEIQRDSDEEEWSEAIPSRLNRWLCYTDNKGECTQAQESQENEDFEAAAGRPHYEETTDSATSSNQNQKRQENEDFEAAAGRPHYEETTDSATSSNQNQKGQENEGHMDNTDSKDGDEVTDMDTDEDLWNMSLSTEEESKETDSQDNTDSQDDTPIICTNIECRAKQRQHVTGVCRWFAANIVRKVIALSTTFFQVDIAG
ncbi:uncharacterized protein [Amphiura filiformis]|uniref:uncharacterized protein n=1 Tax=Amphiura filiformis TaxID=82378 RepID=UPI003B21DDE0